MNRGLQLLGGVITVLVTGCDRGQPNASSGPRPSPSMQVGVASFYGREFAGRTTASGERLRLNAMTAASRTLPIGTHVQVVNAETGQSAKVRINDRGPYAEGRLIDLTPKAAEHVGIDEKNGLAMVTVTPARTGTPAKR